MKILIIDSHKGTAHGIPQNMHWQNAKILANDLGADLIWSYPTVNDNIGSNYDVIIFVHASHYSYVDYKWLEQSPNAKLFYVTNEYNLGEPRILWMAAKLGRKYTVIANHHHSISKVVMKYVNDWIIVNLNSLIYNPKIDESPLTKFFDDPRDGMIYWGSFRKDRAKYFAKYLTSDVTLSTHAKNVDKFKDVGVSANIIGRLNWERDGLFNYKNSLYIEDEITHDNYNFLANRFYESLNYNCIPMFAEECERTIVQSGYPIDKDFMISDSSQVIERVVTIPESWHAIARDEHNNSLEQIRSILQNAYV